MPDGIEEPVQIHITPRYDEEDLEAMIEKCSVGRPYEEDEEWCDGEKIPISETSAVEPLHYLLMLNKSLYKKANKELPDKIAESISSFLKQQRYEQLAKCYATAERMKEELSAGEYAKIFAMDNPDAVVDEDLTREEKKPEYYSLKGNYVNVHPVDIAYHSYVLADPSFSNVDKKESENCLRAYVQSSVSKYKKRKVPKTLEEAEEIAEEVEKKEKKERGKRGVAARPVTYDDFVKKYFGKNFPKKWSVNDSYVTASVKNSIRRYVKELLSGSQNPLRNVDFSSLSFSKFSRRSGSPNTDVLFLEDMRTMLERGFTNEVSELRDYSLFHQMFYGCRIDPLRAAFLRTAGNVVADETTGEDFARLSRERFREMETADIVKKYFPFKVANSLYEEFLERKGIDPSSVPECFGEEKLVPPEFEDKERVVQVGDKSSERYLDGIAKKTGEDPLEYILKELFGDRKFKGLLKPVSGSSKRKEKEVEAEEEVEEMSEEVPREKGEVDITVEDLERLF